MSNTVEYAKDWYGRQCSIERYIPDEVLITRSENSEKVSEYPIHGHDIIKIAMLRF